MFGGSLLDTHGVVDGVMADGVFDAMVSHGAVYRRGPEQNARKQRDKTSSGHDAEGEVGRNDSGWRRFGLVSGRGLKRTRGPRDRGHIPKLRNLDGAT